MPRLATSLIATYREQVLKLAAMEGGVSRPQVMESLGVSRPIADSIISKCDLQLARRDGRTEYFVPAGKTAVKHQPAPTPPDDAPNDEEENDHIAPDGLPPEVEVAVVVEHNALDKLADVVETDDQVLASVDAEITKTRQLLKDTAMMAGRAMGEWLTHQSTVESLREKMQELVTRRLSLSS